MVAAWIFPLLALAVVAPVTILVVSAAFGGIAYSMFGSIWETIKQSHAPRHLRTRLASFDHLGSLGLVPFSYLLDAAALATIGATAGLIAGASILAAATFWVTADASVRDLESHDGQTTDECERTVGGHRAPASRNAVGACVAWL